MQHNSKIFVEAGDRGISKITLETPDSEAGLRFLKHSLPALRLFDSFVREEAQSVAAGAGAAK